jgi:signal transduction histidine kinase
VTIRKTLIFAFAGVGLIGAILLASLAFVKARQALRAEIERNMSVEAASVSADIDKMMFERLQNAAVWSQLDIMQDLQIRDVDKRLSRFLADLKTGYRDIYLDLSCSDVEGRVIASSNTPTIGAAQVAAASWLKTNLSGADLELKFEHADESPGVFIDVPIASAFAEQRLGQLRLQLDWTEIGDVLDAAAGTEGRVLVLLDETGRVISASSALRDKGLLLTDRLAQWQGVAGAVERRSGNPVLDTEVLVGGAKSKGYSRFAGFGWTTLVIQPVDLALEPIHRMAIIFAILLGFILVFTLVIATLVSHAIARPILALTGFARQYMRSKILQSPPAAGSGEVGELTEAFVQMVRDIDLSQQNLVRASKLAVVGEMSSIIAHEVRTPLGILRSSAQMLQRESGISAEGHELIGFIESETERLNRLVSAMLDTARPRSPLFARVDVHALIQRTVAMLAAQANRKQVRVSQRLRASDAVIDCDEEQMTQIVLNILMNGLQILHHGGEIEVSTHDDRSNLYIEIADNGPGINPAERARVFEAFFFKREGGIGLGLAIVQQIVHAHGGEIAATDSRIGGAMFRIRLPRNTQEMA